MLINLKQLPQGKKEFNFTLTREEIGIEEHEKEFKLVGDVPTHLIIHKSRKVVEIRVEITYTLKLQCSRCLEYFEKQYKETETFVFKEGQEPVFKEKALKEEDFYTYFYATEEIDISPLIRDMILLSVPMKPLCKPDCKGLCPICGVNWNKEKCKHMDRKPVNSKLAVLLQYKDKLVKK